MHTQKTFKGTQKCKQMCEIDDAEKKKGGAQQRSHSLAHTGRNKKSARNPNFELCFQIFFFFLLSLFFFLGPFFFSYCRKTVLLFDYRERREKERNGGPLVQHHHHHTALSFPPHTHTNKTYTTHNTHNFVLPPLASSSCPLNISVIYIMFYIHA